MHPFLSDRKRLAAYLGVWTGLGILFASVFSFTNAAPIAPSLLIVLPPTFLFSFECLASWFFCRSLPLRSTTLSRALMSHAFVAAVSGMAWVAITIGWMRLLTAAEVFAPIQANVLHVPWWMGAAAGVYLLSAAFFYVLISFDESQRAEQEALTARMLAQDAELRFLRTQIDPHFLFNSLNSISALTTTNPGGAREMTILLGEFLRTSLHLGSEREIALEQELNLVRQFLQIEQVRFGDRLQSTFEIDPSVSPCKIPPLLIQPLVENAVKHGVGSLLEGGVVSIAASRNGSFVSIRVQNPFEKTSTSAKPSRVGLTNVRQRLQSLYGNEARLITQQRDGVFTAEVILPSREQ